MIQIETSVPHQLGKTVATNRIQNLVGTLSQRFPQQVHQVQLRLSEHHVDVSFAAYGYMVQWQADIAEDRILLHGSIPDTAKQFQHKIEQAIVARVEDSLSPEQSRAA